MKEQKTPEQVLEENNFFPSAIVATMNDVARERLFNAMQSYSDQQNAELRERVKELEAKQSALTSAMHDALSELVQCNYVKANILLYNALETTDEL